MNQSGMVGSDSTVDSQGTGKSAFNSVTKRRKKGTGEQFGSQRMLQASSHLTGVARHYKKNKKGILKQQALFLFSRGSSEHSCSVVSNVFSKKIPVRF